MADSYEQALGKVQEAVEKLESGDLPLEDSINLYSDALKLLKTCYDKLNKVEKKLEGLSGTLGEIMVEKTELP